MKLDISLTREIESDPVKQALTAALVGFAAQIGAHVIAEGVETAAELKTLRGLGVEYAQGYYLGAPTPLPLRGVAARCVSPVEVMPSSAAVVMHPRKLEAGPASQEPVCQPSMLPTSHGQGGVVVHHRRQDTVNAGVVPVINP